MTKDEAKAKWCPFARPVFAGPSRDVAAMNRMGDGTPEAAAMCIASACMAWRWEPDWIYPPVTPGAEPDRFRLGHKKSKTEGFCGLAGNPNV